MTQTVGNLSRRPLHAVEVVPNLTQPNSNRSRVAVHYCPFRRLFASSRTEVATGRDRAVERLEREMNGP